MISKEKFEQHLKESAQSWGGSYVVMSDLIKAKKLKVGAEVGLGYGGNAENMLKAGLEKLYGVDPFRHVEDQKWVMNVPQEDFDDLHDHVTKKLAPFGNKFEMVREFSVKAAEKVPDNLDFVYIDGEHTYEGVFNDLCAWSKKVKMGGIISGHDYNHPNLPGIKVAVDQFFRRFGWEIQTGDNFVWWVEKKPINISFFIPTYNYGKSIREAVESIVKDNFTPGDELIVFNDGSTDDTEKHLSELKSQFPEIKILTHRKNLGPSATRNDCVQACKNEIVFSHDHDNILVPGSIAKLKEFLINTGADVATFGELHYFVGQRENVKEKWIFNKTDTFTLQDALNGSAFPGASGNYMFTKESWWRAGGYPDSWFDSWGFGVRQLATGSRMLSMHDTFYWHQYHHPHGYESTYKKGVRTGRISSLAALQILIPFLNLLAKADVNYIMSPRGRNTWHDQLAKKPLKVIFNTLKEYEEFMDNNPSKLKQILRKSRNVLKKNDQFREIVIKGRKFLRSLKF